MNGFFVVSAGTPYLVHVTYAFFRQLVQPDGVWLHGKDVDIDALLLP